MQRKNHQSKQEKQSETTPAQHTPSTFRVYPAHHPNETLISRIVTKTNWDSTNYQKIRDRLQAISNTLPRVGFVLTPGAFIKVSTNTIFKGRPGTGWNTTQTVFNAIIRDVAPVMMEIIPPTLVKHISQKADYLVLGIDAYSNNIRKINVQLALIIDTATNKRRWTGKSYPTLSEESKVILCDDLKTHTLKSKYGNVAVLGCHDLMAFSGRAASNTKKGSARDIRANEFKKIIYDHKPRVILQLPHYIDSKHTWAAPWKAILNNCTSPVSWVSAFCNANIIPGGPRENIPTLAYSYCSTDIETIVLC